MKKRKKKKAPAPKPVAKPAHHSLVKKPDYPLMTPGEYEDARRHYDLPAIHFSSLMGVGWRQGQRYRDGDSVIPDSVAKLIRTALRHKLAAGEIG